MSSLAPVIAADSSSTVPSTGVPGIKTIAFFGTSNNAGTSGEVAASLLNSDLKIRLASSGVFSITSFSPRLPSIDRALNVDNTLTDADIQQPVTDPNSALKIAKVMGTDGYLLDEVDTYQEDPTSHAITVTVSGYLYYTSTGASARTFAVSGTANPTSPDEGAAAVLQSAVQSAVTQIVTTFGVNGSKSVAVVPNSTYHQSGAATFLLVLLTGTLIGVIAHNNSHPGSVSTASTTTQGSNGSVSTSGGSSGIPGAPPI